MTMRVGKKTLAVILSVALLFGLMAAALPAMMAQGLGTVVDGGGSLTGWKANPGSPLELVDGGAIKLSNDVNTKTLGMHRVFSTPQDFSGVQSGAQALVLRVKVNTSSAVIPDGGSPENKGLRVDFFNGANAEGTGPDWANGWAWTFPSTVLKDGEWTDVVIWNPTQDWFYNWGTLNFSEVRYIGLSLSMEETARLDFQLDSIRLVDAADIPDSVNSNFDTVGGWKAERGSASVSANAPKEGYGSYHLHGADEALAMARVLRQPQDLSGLNSGKVLSFWVKVGDTSTLDHVLFDLFTEEGLDGNNNPNWAAGSIQRWNIPASAFESNKWVEIRLTGADANIAPAASKLNNIKKISIMPYATAKEGGGYNNIDFFVDNMRYADPLDLTGGVIDDCDGTAGWSFTQSTMEPVTDGGVTALKWVKAGDGTNMTAQRLFEQPQDFSSVASGERTLVLRMKTSDASKFVATGGAPNNRGIRMDLVSEAGMTDGVPGWSARRGWTYPGTILSSGEWTDVVFYCKDNDQFNLWPGTLDLSQIRAIYLDFNGVGADIALDSIRLVKTEELAQSMSMDMDTLGDWWAGLGSIAPDLDSPKQGAGSMNLSGGGEAEMNASKLFKNPVNMTGMDADKSLSMWVRVADVSKISSLRIDLYDNCTLKEDGSLDWGQPVTGRYWSIPADTFQSGVWKRIQLTENDAGVGKWGDVDYSKIKMITLHAMSAAGNPELSVSFDDVRFGDYITDFDDDLDAAAGWTAGPGAGSVDVNTTAPKQGAGSLQISGSPDSEVNAYKIFNKPVDLTGMDGDKDKSVSVWVRVDDVSKLDFVRINLFDETSLNEAGEVVWEPAPHGRHWDIPASEFESGKWKLVQLTAANAAGDWNAPDYSKIKRVEFHAMVKKPQDPMVVCFDDLKFGDYIEDEQLESFDDTLDSVDNWTAGQGAVSVNGTDPKEGTGSLQIAGSPQKEVNAGRLYGKPVSVAGLDVENGKSATVWVRVEDVSKLNYVRIDMLDDNCTFLENGDLDWSQPVTGRYWTFPASSFKNGEWKQVQLTEFNALKDWGKPDYTMIKQVVLHAFNTAEGEPVSVCFDDLKVGDYIPEPEEFNNPFDSTEGWTAPQGAVSISTDNPKQGTGSMLLSGAPAEALVAEKVYRAPMDLSGMAVQKDKSVTLWVRVADVTKINYLQIDMYDANCASASGSVDWSKPHLRRWNFPASEFKSGEWKKIQLTDFDSNLQDLWGGCTMDYSKVRKISIAAYVSDKNVQADICFDDMQYGEYLRPEMLNDTFDELYRWEAASGSVSISPQSPKQGTGSLYLTGAPQAPSTALIAKRVYDMPLNLSTMNVKGIGAAALWVKVRDTTKMTKVVIDMADEDGVDTDGNIIWESGKEHLARWEFPMSLFESGEWTRVVLTADSVYRVNPWNCTVDFTRIKLMHMGGEVTASGVQGDLYFDDLYYGDFEEAGETTLDHLDSVKGWTSNAGTFGMATDPDGRTYARLSSKGADATEINMHKYFDQPLDLSAVGTGEKQLNFRFRVNDRSAIIPGGNPVWKGVRIDVVGKDGYTDGSRNWTSAKAWEFSNFRLENDGWATLSISGTDTNTYFNWPELKFSEVQGFAIILSIAKGCDIRVDLDRIYVSDPTPREPDPVEPSILDKMEDNYDGRWTADGGLAEDMTNQEQGDGALVLTADGKTTAYMSRSFTPRLDLRGISEKEKALSLWLKTADISQISSVDVILSMSEDLGDGSGTLTWTIPGDKLLNGQWKEFRLYAGDVTKQQDFEWYWVKSIRLQVNAKEKGASVAFDTLSIYDPHALDPDGSPLVDGPVILQDFEKNNIGQNNGFTLDTTNPHSGASSLKIDWSGSDIAYATVDWKMDPRVNLGNLVMYGGQLEFYVYVSDPARLIDGPKGEPPFKLQIGGDEGPRNYMNCRWYNLDLGSMAKAGEWTKVTIDFDKPTGDTMDQKTYVESPDGREYNLYSTGYMVIQMTLSGKAEGGENAVVMIDDIRAIPNAKPADEDAGGDSIDNDVSFTPKVLDPSVVKFLQYKAVVKENTTLDALLGALEAPENYSVVLVDDKYKDVDDGDALIRTGMWLMVVNDTDGVAVETYYVELGNPLDTSGVEDVDMPGRPGHNTGEPEDGDKPDNPDDSDKTPATGVGVAAAAILTGLTASAALFGARRKRKSK